MGWRDEDKIYTQQDMDICKKEIQRLRSVVTELQNKLSIWTPNGKLFSNTKGVEEEYPGIEFGVETNNGDWIYIGMIEWDTVKEKLQVVIYNASDCADEPSDIIELDNVMNRIFQKKGELMIDNIAREIYNELDGVKCAPYINSGYYVINDIPVTLNDEEFTIETSVCVNKVEDEDNYFYAIYYVTEEMNICQDILEPDYVYTDSLSFDDLLNKLTELYETVTSGAYEKEAVTKFLEMIQ